MSRPTLDDAIAVLAKQAGTTPDEFTIAEFLVDPGYGGYGELYEPRPCTFANDPKVIREAQSLLRIFDQVEKMSQRLKRPPFRNPARPSLPSA